MAMYEERGYCPAHSLFLYKLENSKRIPKYWEKTWKILGDRISFMVYSDRGATMGGGYILEVLMCSKGTLGIEVAAALSVLMPTCSYREKVGRPIVITDYKDLSKLPTCASIKNGECSIKESEILLPESDRHGKRKADVFAFEDERFFVILIDDKKEILMHIHKK